MVPIESQVSIFPEPQPYKRRRPKWFPVRIRQ